MKSKTMVEYDLLVVNKIAEYVNIRIDEFFDLGIVSEEQRNKMQDIINEENKRINVRQLNQIIG